MALDKNGSKQVAVGIAKTIVKICVQPFHAVNAVPLQKNEFSGLKFKSATENHCRPKVLPNARAHPHSIRSVVMRRNNNYPAMEGTTSTIDDEAAASEMHEQSAAAAPPHGVVGVPVDATDRSGTRPTSFQPRKKQKVAQRKPPPAEPKATLSEERFCPTPMDARVYETQRGVVLPGTRYNIPRTEAYAATTMPTPLSRLVPETPQGQLPMTDWLPQPLEYIEPRFPSSRHRTDSDLFAASLLTESPPPNYYGDAIAVTRPMRATNYHPQFQQVVSPPRSTFPNALPHQPGTPAIYASNTFRSAGERSMTSRANYLDLPGTQAALAAVVPNSMMRRQCDSGFHAPDLEQYTPAGFFGANNFSSQEDTQFILAASSQGSSSPHSNNSAGIGTSSEFLLSRTANQILEDMIYGQQVPQGHQPNVDIPRVLEHVGSASVGLSRTANQILEEMLRGQQVPRVPQPNVDIPRALDHASVGQQTLAESTTRPPIPLQMPAIMGQPNDVLYMNEHIVFLRQQIEFFEATHDDLDASTRGRNRRIHVGQVGIRCCHCAHVPAAARQHGSMYFPRTIQGLYQSAQNMSTNHIQCGLCTEMADSVKTKFIELLPSKNLVSRDGARRYWEESAKRQGLVDTEDGIAFQR